MGNAAEKFGKSGFTFADLEYCSSFLENIALKYLNFCGIMYLVEFFDSLKVDILSKTLLTSVKSQ